MRWLVIGARGQVGGALCEHLGPAAVGSARTGPLALDLLRLSEDDRALLALVDRAEPDVVVISAAMTNVDRCEHDREEAWACNALAPRLIARTAARHHIRVVYLSTDYIFDGASGPYLESDIPNPLGVYGSTKLAGEKAVLDEASDSLVVRTTVVWGPESVGRNFAYRLISVLGSGRSLQVPADQFGTPTYNHDLVSAIVGAVEAGRSGIAHMAGSELCDRYTFAYRLSEYLGMDSDLIEPVASADLRQGAVRPLRAGLVSDAPIRSRTVEAAAEHWLSSDRGVYDDVLGRRFESGDA